MRLIPIILLLCSVSVHAQTDFASFVTEVKFMDRKEVSETCGGKRICTKPSENHCVIHSVPIGKHDDTKLHQDLGKALLQCVGEREVTPIVLEKNEPGIKKHVMFDRVSLKWLKAVCRGAMACMIPESGEGKPSKMYVSETVTHSTYLEVMVGHEFWHVYGGRHERI